MGVMVGGFGGVDAGFGSRLRNAKGERERSRLTGSIVAVEVKSERLIGRSRMDAFAGERLFIGW